MRQIYYLIPSIYDIPHKTYHTIMLCKKCTDIAFRILVKFAFAHNWDRINDTILVACLADTEI